MVKVSASAVKSATVTPESFAAAVSDGTVKFHTIRGNGTQRRVKLLTTEQMTQVAVILAKREAGSTMKEIAAELSVSVPTVRRLINAALLTSLVSQATPEEAATLLGQTAASKRSRSAQKAAATRAAKKAATVAATA